MIFFKIRLSFFVQLLVYINFSFYGLFVTRVYSGELGIDGYLKNIAILSTNDMIKNPYFVDITRLRSRWLIDLGKQFHVETWLDTELNIGNHLATNTFNTNNHVIPTYFNLSWKIIDFEYANVSQRLFRAFFSYYDGNFELTIGRQRIAWGSGFVWNPTDIFNPNNPYSIERSEKDGVDVIMGSFSLGTFSRIEGIFAPNMNSDTKTALRYTDNILGYDVSIIGGSRQNEFLFGSDFAGNLKGSVFRAEFAYYFNKKKRATINLS